MNKPVSPKMHGIIDYAFTSAQIILPSLLGVNKSADRLFKLLGSNLMVYNALTNHGASVKPVVPFKTHMHIDKYNLAGLLLLTACKPIRKDKKALGFHLGFLALATLNVLLTDTSSVNSIGNKCYK